MLWHNTEVSTIIYHSEVYGTIIQCVWYYHTMCVVLSYNVCVSTDAILEKIREAGFEIAIQKKLTLTKEQAAEFYKEHEEKDYFDSLCTHMSRYIPSSSSVGQMLPLLQVGGFRFIPPVVL